MQNPNEKTTTVMSNISTIIKICALAFSTFSYIQYTFKFGKVYYTTYITAVTFVAALVFVVFVYSVWDFYEKKVPDINTPFFKILQSSFLFILNVILICFTGLNTSQYKYLFLFAIITASMECGVRIAIGFAVAASLFMVALDLALGQSLPVNSILENDIMLACMFIIVAGTISYYAKAQNDHIAMLRQQVNQDSLTLLYNHRYFQEALKKTVQKSRETVSACCTILCDIDDFKVYNDLLGHQQGDEILRQVSALLKDAVRDQDIVARYGGEEFAVILPDTRLAEGFAVAESLRKNIESHHFANQEYMPSKNLTISVGIAEFPKNAVNEVELVKFADDALYRAKFLRKNRTVSYINFIQDELDHYQDGRIITSIRTLIAIIDSRDKYTYSHVERVVHYCKLFAKWMRLSAEDERLLVVSACMHDIGKINISKELLIKSGRLTDAEMDELRQHPQVGADIISKIPALSGVSEVVLEHHERYDGNGYPQKLKGEEIRPLARMLTVADSFDAMTTDRPYKKGMSYEDGCAELVRCAGTQFDPEYAREFVGMVKAELGIAE